MTAKKKLLFVDDRAKRIREALEKYSGFDVSIAPNVPEALRLLSREDFEIVSLDFDLDGHDFSDPDSKVCGMEIVRYIRKTGWPERKRIPQFVIHSSNAFGAELMYQALSEMFRSYRVYKDPFILDKAVG